MAAGEDLMYQEKVTLSLQGLDPDAWIMPEIIAKLPDIDIQVPRVKKGIIPPHRYQ